MIEPIEGSWRHVEATVLRRSGGQCECSGECGFNHRWEEGAPVQRCKAPHACTIQRKKDYPSFWMLAGTQDVPLAHPEYFAPKRIRVELSPTAIDGDQDNRDPQNIKALCQRCKVHVERNVGETT